RDLGGASGRADVEAVAVYRRTDREVFTSRIDEVNGNTRVEPGATDAIVEVLDFPLLATLLFENTREGRAINYDIGGFDVFYEQPPPAGVDSFGAAGGDVISDAFGQM